MTELLSVALRCVCIDPGSISHQNSEVSRDFIDLDQLVMGVTDEEAELVKFYLAEYFQISKIDTEK